MLRYLGMITTVTIFAIAVISLPQYLDKGTLPNVRLILGVFFFIAAITTVAELGMRQKAKGGKN